ncbi:hypothetical protein PF011_g16504 [Phytophthora fragariae]|uniref:Uncharacterized protein n=1 Tax=Phytophthora fragariae TaxID=53985 RepID=A0A6A3JSD6_9STRA|nr:hypothetical protein PF011_g16504 [Phytophthora fragariae]
MTTKTQIIMRAAPNALQAAGPAKHHANASAPGEDEEKPPAPASTKPSGDPKNPAVKRPAAKHPPKKKGTAKESPKALNLPP